MSFDKFKIFNDIINNTFVKKWHNITDNRLIGLNTTYIFKTINNPIQYRVMNLITVHKTVQNIVLVLF